MAIGNFSAYDKADDDRTHRTQDFPRLKTDSPALLGKTTSRAVLGTEPSWGMS